MDELLHDVCVALDEHSHLLYNVSGLTKGDVKRSYGVDVGSCIKSMSPIRFVDRFVGEREDFECLCELLSLFPLLAHQDPQLWTRRISRFWDERATAAVTIGDPFVFGVIASRQHLRMLRSSVPCQTPSAWCSSLITRAASLFDVAISPVPVIIVLSFEPDEDAPSTRLREEIQLVLEVVEPASVWARIHEPRNQSFSIVEVYVNYQGRLLADIETAEIMKQLASFGVRFHDLLGIASDDQARMLACLNGLVPPNGSTSSPHRVLTATVSTAAAIASTQATVSAIVGSLAIGRVKIDCRDRSNGMVNEVFWRWIGVAMVSHQHGVCGSEWQLQLDPCMVVEDVEFMRSVVEAKDPLAVLAGDKRDAMTDDVVVSASRFSFAARPTDWRQPAATNYTCSNMLAVQAIKKVSNGYSVLLPGYDKAWVRAEDIIAVENKGTSFSYRASNLDAVLTRVTGDSVPGILAFFNAFGGSGRKIKWKACLLRSKSTLRACFKSSVRLVRDSNRSKWGTLTWTMRASYSYPSSRSW